jgi:hypothetical protein
MKILGGLSPSSALSTDRHLGEGGTQTSAYVVINILTMGYIVK